MEQFYCCTEHPGTIVAVPAFWKLYLRWGRARTKILSVLKLDANLCIWWCVCTNRKILPWEEPQLYFATHCRSKSQIAFSETLTFISKLSATMATSTFVHVVGITHLFLCGTYARRDVSHWLVCTDLIISYDPSFVLPHKALYVIFFGCSYWTHYLETALFTTFPLKLE